MMIMSDEHIKGMIEGRETGRTQELHCILRFLKANTDISEKIVVMLRNQEHRDWWREMMK